jgi:hypothetical protein
MSDFDKIKFMFKRFVEDHDCNLINSENEFITNRLLRFLNSDDDNDYNFKKTLEDNLRKTSNNNTENINIEMSKIIKGDFIVFETYNLFQDAEQGNITSDINNLSDDEITDEFTESFEQLF